MISLWRFAVYAALTFPLAYFMGITFLERRLHSYRMVGVVLGPALAVFLFDRFASGRWARYRTWRSNIGKRHLLATKIAWILIFAAVLAKPTAILIPIGVGIFPMAYGALAVALILGVAMQVRRSIKWPSALRLDPIALVLVLNYAGVACMAVAYFGSTDARCDEVSANPFLKPLITRSMIDRRSDVSACFAYDVKSDLATDRLFFSLKQKRSGLVKKFAGLSEANDAIGMMDRTTPDFDRAELIPIAGASTGTYPQRITVNAERREIYVVVLDIDGRHSVWVIGYEGGMKVRRVIELDYEPIRVYVEDQKLIIVGYEGNVGVYDIDTYERRLFRHLDNLGFMGVIDTFVRRPDRRTYYASVVSRHFLVLDDTTFETLMAADVGVPTIGLDYDPVTNRVYAAATLTREVLVLDGDDLRVVDRIKTGASVRELTIDRNRRLAVTAGYIDGDLLFIDLDSNRVVARLFLGRLARSVHVESESGRLFVTSSCGLFEVKTDEFLQSSGFVRTASDSRILNP